MTGAGAILEPKPSVRRLEDKAAECLHTCCHALGLGRVPFPVPVDDWIERPLGIRLGYADLSDWGTRVEGVAVPRERRILISERLAKRAELDPRAEARLRFTCAHELGHVLLHSRIKAPRFRDADPEDETTFDRYEWQANRFAAAFLMPLPHLLWAVVDAITEARGTDPLARLLTGNPETEGLWRSRVIPEIVRRFGVSRTAAIIRLGSVRLIDTKPLLFPAMADRLMTQSRSLFDQSAAD